MTALITLNDFLNIFHFALYNANTSPPTAINICSCLLFKGKHSLSRRYYEADFFVSDYITCFFPSAAAACFTVNWWERKPCPGRAGGERRTFSSRVSFTGAKGSPRSPLVLELAPVGVCPQPGRRAGRGAGAHAELRGQPGCAAPARPGAGLAGPKHLARPPANFSERVPAPAPPRSHRLPQRLSPVSPTLTGGAPVPCVCLASPAAALGAGAPLARPPAGL